MDEKNVKCEFRLQNQYTSSHEKFGKNVKDDARKYLTNYVLTLKNCFGYLGYKF